MDAGKITLSLLATAAVACTPLFWSPAEGDGNRITGYHIESRAGACSDRQRLAESRIFPEQSTQLGEIVDEYRYEEAMLTAEMRLLGLKAARCFGEGTEGVKALAGKIIALREQLASRQADIRRRIEQAAGMNAS